MATASTISTSLLARLRISRRRCSGYRDGGFEVSVLENPDRTEIADGVQAVLDDLG